MIAKAWNRSSPETLSSEHSRKGKKMAKVFGEEEMYMISV